MHHLSCHVLAALICASAAIVAPARAQHTASSASESIASGAPKRSFTAAGVPGDALNIAFIGSEDDLQRAMATARWVPADPITFRSSLRITVDSVFRRAYADAPVSNLYVEGRRQDLAFEQPAASNPSKRHHVRFWRLAASDRAGTTLWIGAATYDVRIGLSHVNRHVTHHIAADIDAERDKLLADLNRNGDVAIAWIDGFQPDREGHNGGGDPFHTDGRLAVVIAPAPTPAR